MAELKLDARDLVNISLGLEDRELILRNGGNHHAANHFRNLRMRWDLFLGASMPETATLVVSDWEWDS